MNDKTLIVVPTYQESANIDELLRSVRQAEPDADVLVVDDRSPDGTARPRGGRRNRARPDHGAAAGREAGSRRGVPRRFRVGSRRRGYDVLVEMDADLSHDPCVLPSLLREIRGGADLAIGSPLRPRRRDAELAGTPAPALPQGNLYAPDARAPHDRRDFGLPRVPRDGRSTRSASARPTRRATASRSSSCIGSRGAAGGSPRSRSCSTTGRAERRRCRRGSPGRGARARHVVGVP